MKALSLDEPAGVLVKTTLVDFPGRVAGSFFLKGCNLRCPYCYNIGLVDPNAAEDDLNTVQELFNHLEKRQGILSGLVVSGGEPMINPYTKIIVKKAKELGYKVKLDTNGLLPQKIKAFLEDKELCPDFIAMDIKTSPKKYGKTLCTKSLVMPSEDAFVQILKESVELISSLPPDCREFRTVLVPPLISREDIENIAQILPKDASWQFAQFRNENCLDPAYNEISPYTDPEIKELIDFAKTMIQGANLR